MPHYTTRHMRGAVAPADGRWERPSAQAPAETGSAAPDRAQRRSFRDFAIFVTRPYLSASSAPIQ